MPEPACLCWNLASNDHHPVVRKTASAVAVVKASSLWSRSNRARSKERLAIRKYNAPAARPADVPAFVLVSWSRRASVQSAVISAIAASAMRS